MIVIGKQTQFCLKVWASCSPSCLGPHRQNWPCSRTLWLQPRLLQRPSYEPGSGGCDCTCCKRARGGVSLLGADVPGRQVYGAESVHLLRIYTPTNAFSQHTHTSTRARTNNRPCFLSYNSVSIALITAHHTCLQVAQYPRSLAFIAKFDPHKTVLLRIHCSKYVSSLHTYTMTYNIL